MIQQPTLRDEAWLEQPLIGRLNWEKIAYIVLILLALATRLYDLGTRAMSHDESLHTYFSYNFAIGKGYVHTPLMHGPFLFHITALSYFLFGDSDFTSRLPYALMGVATVGMSWYFRRWLGRAGALVMALALLVSPSNLYYSRYIRQEASIIIWNLITILAVWRFMQTRSWKYMLLLTGALAFHAADKSTNFFAVAQMSAFLALIYVIQANAAGTLRSGLISGAIKFVTLFVGLLLGSCLLFEALGRLLTNALSISVNISENGVNLNSGAYASIVILVLCSAGAGFGMSMLLRAMFSRWLKDSTEHTSAFTPLVVMVSTTLLMSSAAILLLLNPLWKLVTGGLLIDVSMLGNMGNLNNNVTVVITMLSLSMALIALSAALGVAWNWRRYIQALGLFLVITIPQFTSLFTNPGGIASGFVGQLGYWMAQQDVMRGSQPSYYYFVIVPLYEYAVIFGSILATIYLARRAFGHRPLVTYDNEVDGWVAEPSAPTKPVKSSQSALPAGLTRKTEKVSRSINLFFMEINIAQDKTYFVDDKGNRVQIDEEEQTTPSNRASLAEEAGGTLKNVGLLFPLFLVWYMISNWATYTAAGEKMPWLTIHIALPMAMLTGWLLNHVISGGAAAWRRLNGASKLWLLALSGLGVVFGTQLLSSIGAWPDKADARTAAFVTFVIKLIAFLATVYAARRVTQRDNAGTLVPRGLLLAFFVLLAVLTARTAIIASFINFDYTKEFLFYAHGGNTVKTGLNQLSELSQRLNGGNTIKVGYDSDSSWPISWYMRDFPNSGLIGTELPGNWQEYDAFIIGDYNTSRDKISQDLANNFTKYKYMLVWWPMEDYKNISLDSVWKNLSNTQWRAAIWDIVFSRDYKKYSTFYSIRSLTPEEWSPGHPYFLFIRNDVAARVWDYRSSTAASGSAPLPQPPAAAAISQGFKNTALGSVAVSGNDRIVVDYRNSRLIKVDANGEIKFNLGGKGNATGKFDAPWGVVTDNAGNIIVADTFNHRVQRLDKDGNFLGTWGSPGVTNAPGNGKSTQFFGPRDLTFDKNGKLLVVDTGNKRVQVFEPDGTYISQFGSEGNGPSQFLEPVGIDVSTEGEIYIADMWNKRIQVFDSGYKFAREFPVEEWTTQAEGDLRAVDNKAYLASTAKALLISSPKHRKVLTYSLDGRKLDTDLGLPSSISPVGLSIRNNKLVVSDANGGGVIELDLPASVQ